MSGFSDGTDVHIAPVAVATRLGPQMRCTRPSLLDPFLAAEPSLAPCVCMPNVAVLYVANRPIAVIQATNLDHAALDSWLGCLRARSPRALAEA